MAAEAGGDAWVAQGVLPLAGAWEVAVTVRQDRFSQVSGRCHLVLGDAPVAPGSGVPETTPTGVTVSGAWVRETLVAGLEGAAYLVIHNGNATDDALVGASSPSVVAVELHQTTASTDGTVAMGPVAEIPIPANGEVALEPGGYHLLLVDPAARFVPGEEVELTLTFAEAAPQTASVPVLAGAPTDPSHGH
jgi:copper(I)-binding protein